MSPATSGSAATTVRPGGVRAAVEAEKARRRAVRFRQVRRQASEAARAARQRTAALRRRRMDELALEELRRYRESKEVELAALEEEYRACLRDLGTGHDGAADEEADRAEAEARGAEEARAARARGAEALRRQRERQRLGKRVEEERRGVRQSAAAAERLRAAEVRSAGRERMAREGREQLVELDADTGRRKVTLVDRRRLGAAGGKGAATVRRVPLADVGNTGLEAAIRDQEQERRKEQEKRAAAAAAAEKKRAAEREWSRIIPRRGAPQRSSCQEMEGEDEDSEDWSSKRLSTIAEESSRAAASMQEDGGDVDLFPVRGPSSSASSSGEGSRPRRDRPQERQRQQEQQQQHLDDQDLANIRSLLQQVERQKRDLTGLSQEIDQVEARRVEGRGAGAKSDDSDRRFVAKVLGIPPESLVPTGGGGKEGQGGEKGTVKVRRQYFDSFVAPK